MTISNGYVSLAEFKAYENITSTDATDDTVIEDIIEAASRYIDAQSGRTFYARSETRYYSVPHEEARRLEVDDDLLSIATLTNGDAVVIPATEYYLWPRNVNPKTAIIIRQLSTYTWATNSTGETEYVISVVGSWGYSTAAPDDVKNACMQISLALYKRRHGENMQVATTITAGGVFITPRDIPSAALAVIERYRRRL